MDEFWDYEYSISDEERWPNDDGEAMSVGSPVDPPPELDPGPAADMPGILTESAVSADAGGAHVGVARTVHRHSPDGPVMSFFWRIIGHPPSRKAMCQLRALFPVTGPITRAQRRKTPIMAAAFEKHAEAILSSMEDPKIHETVVRILVNGNRRLPDCEIMLVTALQYLDGARLPRSWAKQQ
jgi:hypothetical protein